MRDFKVKYGELSPHFPHTCFGVFCGVCYKKNMEIFDTHTYLNADDFAGREAEELALAKEMGVTRHNVVGFDAPTIKRAIELAEEYPEIYATIGWHPTEAGSYNQEVEDMIVANL